MFSNQEQFSGKLPFSAAQIQQVLGSAEGRQLLALLQRDGGTALRQAAQQIAQGNYEAAKAILEPVMSTGEAAELVRKLNEANTRRE